MNIILNGQMWDIGMSKPDALDLTSDARKTLCAYITPMSWRLAYGDVGAFIAWVVP